MAKIGVPYFHILDINGGVYFDTIKVEKILEGCLDLIPPPLPFMKIQIIGGKMRKSGIQIPASEGHFFFHFQILHTKLHISDFNGFLISCFTNQISIKTNIFNVFYLISK